MSHFETKAGLEGEVDGFTVATVEAVPGFVVAAEGAAVDGLDDGEVVGLAIVELDIPDAAVDGLVKVELRDEEPGFVV